MNGTTTARVRNWHKRNLRSAAVIPVEILCHATGGDDPQFQLRLKSDHRGSLHVLFTKDEARRFALLVKDCMKKV